jgi:hypothetical protein
MDLKTVELAAKLTEKAMGSDGGTATVTWIGKEDQVTKFLDATAHAIETLLYAPNPRSGR